jgi:hypothetical protein
MPPVHP